MGKVKRVAFKHALNKLDQDAKYFFVRRIIFDAHCRATGKMMKYNEKRYSRLV